MSNREHSDLSTWPKTFMTQTYTNYFPHETTTQMSRTSLSKLSNILERHVISTQRNQIARTMHLPPSLKVGPSANSIIPRANPTSNAQPLPQPYSHNNGTVFQSPIPLRQATIHLNTSIWHRDHSTAEDFMLPWDYPLNVPTPHSFTESPRNATSSNQ